jgi:hypothetical protein
MSLNPLLKTMGYFAVKSDKPLEVVCQMLQQHYGLPNFDFDVEDDWEYANSCYDSIGWNVTKTEDLDGDRTRRCELSVYFDGQRT